MSPVSTSLARGARPGGATDGPDASHHLRGQGNTGYKGYGIDPTVVIHGHIGAIDGVDVETDVVRFLAEGGRRVGVSGPMFLAEDRAAESRGDLQLSAFGIRFVLKGLVEFAAIAKRIQLSPPYIKKWMTSTSPLVWGIHPCLTF